MCFFFSSRRRHTRLQGDWSSDVCSSDLMKPVELIERALANSSKAGDIVVDLFGGSEERRVGKECRSRWSPDHSKKKQNPRTSPNLRKPQQPALGYRVLHQHVSPRGFSFHPEFIEPHHRFFFQAEDGIRDYKVTGVQTCALPI